MPEINDIAKLLAVQHPYEYTDTEIRGGETVLRFRSKRRTGTEECPFCGGHVHICGNYKARIRDMPMIAGTVQSIEVAYHRYRCRICRRSFSEDIPFRYPGTRISRRAAAWISSLLRFSIPISTVQRITKIHWDTIKSIHRGIIGEAIAGREKDLISEGYRPRHLAVDEFAIHKGHRYATCVMDLDRGDVIWAGKGRSKADFRQFFLSIDPEYLSEVEAVAMDMNASYHILVEQYLPAAQIVYDRYHMQAQFGREVIGAVRLREAGKHKDHARILSEGGACIEEIRNEKRLYGDVKRARWILLAGAESLSDEKSSMLKRILDTHSELALCHSMKEEMSRLFSLRDMAEARKGWIEWFEGAKESGVPALVRFARLKEKRIDGLIAHASHPISSGRLEGFNNRIKVAKRIGYGYRDDEYFFSLIRFLSIPLCIT